MYYFFCCNLCFALTRTPAFMVFNHLRNERDTLVCWTTLKIPTLKIANLNAPPLMDL